MNPDPTQQEHPQPAILECPVFHLPIEKFTGTPEEIEQQWYDQVYKGRGDSMRQLSWRAVLMGSVLGGVLSLTNLYIGLKSGWGFGVAITACILSYSIWSVFLKLGFSRTPMTILENNCMQSTASSAGMSTGGTLISAFAAYIILNGHPLPIGLTMAWVFFLAVLGVTMAVPMKRQMINIDQLRFPSGVAAAETLQALHAHGDSGMRAARALGISGIIAAVDKFWAEGLGLVSAHWEKFTSVALLDKLQGKLFSSFPIWQSRSMTFSWDILFLAAGAITGMRVCISMLIGGTLCWGVFVPMVQQSGANSRLTSSASFKDDARQTAFVANLISGGDPLAKHLWAQFPEDARAALVAPGLTVAAAKKPLLNSLNKILEGACLYNAERFVGVELSDETKALLAMPPGKVPAIRVNRRLLEDAYPKWVADTQFRGLMQWTLWGGTACMVTSGILGFLLQWSSVMRAFRTLGKIFSRGKTKLTAMEEIETPMSWFAIGQIVSLIALAWLAHASFAMPYWQSVLAVLLSFALSLVACRITGETDTTPIGAMGKVTQLTFGALNPGNINVNLMSANITAGAAGSAADLLTDLKSGYLLGANPRKQFIAQFAGIFIGTLVTVGTFAILVPRADVLGSKQFPAPSAQTWAAVGKAMSEGLSSLEPIKVWSIILGGAAGIIMVLLPLVLPKRWEKWLPSAAGVGLAWVFEWNSSLMFFLGAVIAWAIERRKPEVAKEYTFPVASGLIAGGALMGVFLIFWANGPEMVRQFLNR